jgi:hypothetical protein
VSPPVSARLQRANETAPATTAPATGRAGLKTIDPAALQALVDETMQDLLVPGAVVVIWADLTMSLNNQFTAQEMMVKVLDQIYALSPLPTTTTTTTTAGAP